METSPTSRSLKEASTDQYTMKLGSLPHGKLGNKPRKPQANTLGRSPPSSSGNETNGNPKPHVEVVRSGNAGPESGVSLLLSDKPTWTSPPHTVAFRKRPPTRSSNFRCLQLGVTQLVPNAGDETTVSEISAGYKAQFAMYHASASTSTAIPKNN